MHLTKLLDILETLVEWLIFAALAGAVVIKINSIVEALFYATLAAIIFPYSQLERGTRRYLLVGGFLLGLFAGYFS